MHNVQLNKNWRLALESNNENIDNNEKSTSDVESGNDKEEEHPCKTLIHGFIESRYIYRMQDKLILISPTQGNYPIGILKDKYAK